jgi:hypothetical protein
MPYGDNRDAEMAISNGSNFSLTVDLPAKILETLTDSLSKVGIELPTYLLQGFLFVLAVVPLVLAIQRVRKAAKDDQNKAPMDPKLIIAVVGFGLIVCGILFAWAEQILYPLPREIKGNVHLIGATERALYGNMRVIVLDYQDQSLGEGFVDTASGNYAAFWKAGFGNRPRKIRVTADGCSDQIVSIGYDRLRSGNVNVQITCGGH